MIYSANLSRAIRNIGWHSTERFLRMGVGLLVGLWIARFLGPEKFGNFSYITSWLGLFNAIAWLGVGETAIRDMVRDRCNEGQVLGSALIIRLNGSLLAILLATASARWIGNFDASQMLLLLVLCIGLPFAEALGGVHIWFVSHTNIKPVFFGKCFSLLIGAALRVGVILSGSGMILLMFAVATESIVFGLSLAVAYVAVGERFSHWRFNVSHSWKMFISGMPVVLAGLVTTLNARVDQLVLGRLSNMADVGLYAAAMRFSEVWWGVAPMIVLTLAPHYIFPERLGPKLQENIARIVTGMMLLSLIPCLLISIFGSELIRIILGDQFYGADNVLKIHIWIAVLVFIDAPVIQYLLATNRQRPLIARSVILLVSNLGLSIVLVPLYGPTGAASAALIAQVVTIFLLPLIYAPLRDLLSIYWLTGNQVGGLFRATFRWVIRRPE